MRGRSGILLGFVFLLFSSAGMASRLIYGDTLPTDRAVLHGTLVDGLTYYIKHNNSPAGKIFIQVAVKAGYFHQDADQPHVAHVLEHMGFQSSENFENIGQFLRSQGLQAGTDYNAATGFTGTNYWISIPSTDTVLIRRCLIVARDWCKGLLLDSGAIEVERGNVANEMRGAGRLTQNLESSIIADVDLPPSIESTPRSIDKFTTSSVRRFYADWYRSDLQAVFIVGAFNEVAMLRLFKSVFDVGAVRTENRPWRDYIPAISEKRRFIMSSEAKRDRIIIRQYHRLPGRRMVTVSDFRHNVLVGLYNAMMGERCKKLDENVKESMTVFSNKYVSGIINADAEVDAILSEVAINKVLSRTSIIEILKAMLTEEERVRRYGFSQQELDVAIESLQRSLSSAGRSSEILANDYRLHFYGKRSLASPCQEDSLYRKILKDVSVHEVSELAMQGMRVPTDIIVIGSKQFSDLLPDSVAISDLKRKVSKARIAPYKPPRAIALKRLLSTREVERLASKKSYYVERRLDKLDVTCVTLANGVEIILKPLHSADATPHVVRLAVSKPMGASRYPGRDYWAARYCSRLVYECGIGEHSKAAIEQFLAADQATVRPYVMEDRVGIDAEFPTTSLESALQIVYQYLRYPRRDVESFNRARDVLAGSTSVHSVYDSILHSFRDRADESHDLQGVGDLKIDRVLEIYKEIFWNSGGLMVVVTGDFEPSAILPKLSQYFSEYPDRKTAPEKQVRTMEHEARAYEVVQKRAKDEVDVNVYLFGSHSFSGREMLSLSILAKAIEERLVNKLRDEMGSTYSVSANAGQIKSDIYQIVISFTTFNQTAEAMLAATWKEVSDLATRDVSDTFLQGIINQEKADLTRSLADSYFWEKYFYFCGVNNTRYDDVLQWEELVSKMTATELREIIRQFIRYDSIYRKILKDV